MYSLDVNFLKDRNSDVVRSTQTTTITLTGDDLQKQMPLYIGAGIMVILPALAGLGVLLINWQKGVAQTNIQRLETELTQLQGEQQKIQEVEAKTAAAHQEADGLIGVFNQIKPWSALFQEITNQLPQEVQLQSIQQEGNVITLSGFAGNYGSLNDFLLTLQSSKFLQANKTKLMTANAAALPITGEGATAETGGTEEPSADQAASAVVIPAGVSYTIQTEITNTPDKELITALIANGAAGLVARFKFLELKGVLDRPAGIPEVAPILEPPAEGAPGAETPPANN
ncbi:PilN domain-containing protein [Synechocystis sp. B12]|nr:PilN domain-containing protein [Synechocystis sp. B12]